MRQIVHKVASWFLKRRIDQIEHFISHPHATQQVIFQHLISNAKNTDWGRQYGYGDIRSVDDFRARVPISTYEDIFPWIERVLNGEQDVLWPGKTAWFAKSSGTTNDKSKFIPVTPESLDECHYKAGQDMLCMYFHNKPDSKMFAGKSLSIGGSHTIHQHNKFARYGDLSAVIVENLPRFYELMRTPSKPVALMDNWEEKLEAMAQEVIKEDVTTIAGVPTWTLVLIQRLFEMRKDAHNLLDIWPNMELYIHGGVSFEPYREQFKQLIPSEQMTYLDCYNASEGFFAVQSELNARDMLLMLDYGIFYEFIPIEFLDQDHPPTHVLGEVEVGRTYAMVISTNGGLWRYQIGDTVTFTSIDPYKIKVTGRTKHFINAFGEELVVENAEMAISAASKATGAIVSNYTAAPIYFKDNEKGGHEWLIEFDSPPQTMDRFTQILDQTLQQLNTDYEAKRQGNLALGPPVVHSLPNGSFHAWMKKRGKLGGQNKVPRLANHRKYVSDILEMLEGVS